MPGWPHPYTPYGLRPTAQPPSTTKVWPLTQFPKCVARKTAAQGNGVRSCIATFGRWGSENVASQDLTPAKRIGLNGVRAYQEETILERPFDEVIWVRNVAATIMDHIQSLLIIAAIYLATKASPGPIFFVLSRYAMAGSKRTAALIALGVTVGSLVWATMSLLGLAALLTQIGWLYTGLRLAGAAYLIYLGTMLLRASRRQLVKSDKNQRATHALSTLHALRLGLVTSLTNPKSGVFWSSVFLVAFPVSPPGWVYAATFILVLIISLGWHMLLVMMFSTDRVRGTYMRFNAWIDRVAGSVLILFGIRLAFDDR